MVSTLNHMYLDHFNQTGAEFILGSGRFVDENLWKSLLPDGSIRRLRGPIIVSTGTRAALESTPALVDAQPLTHIEALELDEIPGPTHRDRRRLRRPGIIAGNAPIRQQGHNHRSQ